MRPTDRDLVTFWLERNDAQNYVVLGDPAVRIRKEALYQRAGFGSTQA
jgi:hypothetical protein